MDPVTLLIQIAVSYLIGRINQPNGPRTRDLSAGLGDYGVVLPRLFGEVVRIVGVVIAQAPIKETVHKKKPVTDYIFGLVGALLPPVKTYTYSDTLALALADRTDDEPIEGLVSMIAGGKTIFRASESAVISTTLDADGRLVRKKYGPNRYLKSVTVYGGGIDQVADPILTSIIGPQPGYRRTAYVVIEDLQLKEFGQSVPVPIECLVAVKAGESLADVIETVCAAATIDPIRELSSTAASDDLVRGLAITDEATCWDALKPLLPAFAIEAAEVAGKVRIYKRSQSLRSSISPEDMGAHVYGDEPPERFMFNRAPDKALPQETSLTFLDPNRDYQPNTATSRRSEGNAASNVNVTLPLVMTADEGASAAALMHWDAWLGRTQGKFTLTDAWVGIDPGRTYVIDVGGQFVPYRITQKTRGANGIIEVEALSDEAVTYTASVSGTSGNPIPPISTLIPETRIVLIDGPILVDEDDEYGFYVVTGGGDDYWSQGDVVASLTDGDYQTLETSNESAVVGDVVGTLAAGSTTGLDDTLDTTSVLTITLMHDGMTLESATDDELDDYENLAFVGKDGLGEYLQWKTATFISGSTWELTDLRRGRKGTDWAITGHVSGEEFAVLSDGGRFRLPATVTDGWGVPLYMKGVTFNQDEADVTPQLFTNTGEGKRPYSPVNVEGAWDGSNNLTITWDARSRLNAGGLGIDDNEEWEVEILSGTGRVELTATESWIYTAADQTSDGVTPGDSISGRVRQTSDVNDGRWRNFALTGPDDSWELEDDTTPIHLEDGSTPLGLE
jgi:hypothetical protein